MVKEVLAANSISADIISAGNLSKPVTQLVTGAASIAPDSQIAALEKYIVLADKAITMLGQLNGIFGRFADLKQTANQREPEPEPMPREPLPEEERRLISAVKEAAPMNEKPTTPDIDVREISAALELILSKAPDLSVKQLKQLIDEKPDEINSLIRLYRSGVIPEELLG